MEITRFKDLAIHEKFIFSSENGVDVPGVGRLAWQGARGPWRKMSARKYVAVFSPMPPRYWHRVGTVNVEVERVAPRMAT